MKTITLECAQCKKVFDKNVHEHKRRVQAGAFRFFCSMSCTALAGNSERPKRGKKRRPWKENVDKFGPKIRTSSTVSRIRQRARERGVPCNLTNTIFWEMMEKQNGYCAYSGEKMTIDKIYAQSQVTVDRIIPQNGYVVGNMVLCCRWVNMAKGIDSLEDLVNRAKLLVERNQS